MTILVQNNPAIQLFRAKRPAIVRTRRALFHRVDSVAPGLSAVAARVLAYRSKDDDTPSLGEMWPWVLADLTGLKTASVRIVAEPWLALYVYTILLDRQADEPSLTDPSEVLLASLLFEMGMGDLWRLTAGTPWCDVIRASVHHAVSAQVSDVRHKASWDDLDGKRKSAADKNSGIVAGAAAFASVATVDPSALVAFARAILLPFQQLDDIADFAEDYAARNYTPLLVGARGFIEPTGADARQLDERALLQVLIRSGSLQAVLHETRSVLAKASTDVARAYTAPSASPSIAFFKDLEHGLAQTESAVKSARRVLEAQTEAIRTEDVLSEVRRRLIIVAQTT